MSIRICLGAALAVFLAQPLAARDRAEAPAADPLEAMAGLIGSCWHGSFTGRSMTDTHCFTRVYGGAHVRDRHRVEGGPQSYEGETIYSWNAEAQRIDYVYFNSDGGVSTGSIMPTETGFVSAEERYDAPDGTSRVMQSFWTVDGDQWQQRTQSGETLLWQVDYRRRPLSDYPELSGE